MRKKSHEILFLAALWAVILFVTGYELKLLHSEILIKNILSGSIDFESFRNYQINGEILEEAEEKSTHFIKKYPKLQKLPYIDPIGCLTFSMMADSYHLQDLKMADDRTFLRGIGRVIATPSFQELYEYNKAILSDLKYFPVPKVESGKADISYTDTWYELRQYGGKRKHEGTDLMASNNLRGYFPVISITDGTVEKMGWLEQGGYRVGIRSGSGGYYYYAHLSSYANGLSQGDSVIAGQLLGFMGDSGYGTEGTVGKFDVHLHLGIYVNTKSGEMSINPYSILKLLEKYRTSYGYEK
jgi:hypothetical protein